MREIKFEGGLFMRIINWLKGDYRSVKYAVKQLTKGKAPDWAILLYYVTFIVVTWPLLGLLWIGFKIWMKILFWKMKKLERERA